MRVEHIKILDCLDQTKIFFERLEEILNSGMQNLSIQLEVSTGDSNIQLNESDGVIEILEQSLDLFAPVLADKNIRIEIRDCR